MIITRRTVVVRDLEILISIGVHEHEKTAPQRFVVSVEVEIAAPARLSADDVSLTVDYDAICDFIRSLAKEPHIELQETVAERVLEFTLGLAGVQSALVETCKPDVFSDCEYVGVSISGRNA
jgi:dihydroneopterin aldolase